MMFSLQEFLVIILIRCKFVHFNQNKIIAKYLLILLKICLCLKDEGSEKNVVSKKLRFS